MENRSLSKTDYSKLKFNVMKSDLQIQLERNGCIFNGQEELRKHEISMSKPCFCGRKNNGK